MGIWIHTTAPDRSTRRIAPVVVSSGTITYVLCSKVTLKLPEWPAIFSTSTFSLNSQSAVPVSTRSAIVSWPGLRLSFVAETGSAAGLPAGFFATALGLALAGGRGALANGGEKGEV